MLSPARDIHRIILEELQGIIMLLEDQLKPLIQAEQSVLVDVLYKPELLFPAGAEARHKCENGGESGSNPLHLDLLVVSNFLW